MAARTSFKAQTSANLSLISAESSNYFWYDFYFSYSYSYSYSNWYLIFLYSDWSLIIHAIIILISLIYIIKTRIYCPGRYRIPPFSVVAPPPRDTETVTPLRVNRNMEKPPSRWPVIDKQITMLNQFYPHPILIRVSLLFWIAPPQKVPCFSLLSVDTDSFGLLKGPYPSWVASCDEETTNDSLPSSSRSITRIKACRNLILMLVSFSPCFITNLGNFR